MLLDEAIRSVMNSHGPGILLVRRQRKIPKEWAFVPEQKPTDWVSMLGLSAIIEDQKNSIFRAFYHPSPRKLEGWEFVGTYGLPRGPQ